MGLDAVVYKRLAEIPLPPTVKFELLQVQDVRGEVYLADDEPGLTKEDVRAIHERLGNITRGGALGEELGAIVGDSNFQSLLLSNVLHDGTHGGDIIPLENRELLKTEISLVKEVGGPKMSSELREFLTDMGELIAASEHHGNPTVFI
jgi:hypothetical protein